MLFRSGVGIYDYLNIRKTLAEANGSKFVLAQVGLGLYLVIGGAIVAFVAGLDWSKEANRGPETVAADPRTALQRLERDIRDQLPPPPPPPS